MAKLTLSFACGQYDLTQGLIDGSTAPQGIDLIPMIMSSPERHWRLARGHEFDICEFSMAGYLVGHEAGLPYTAIPVFPHRRFRHGYAFVNTNAGIARPSDLAGKRVCVRTWQTTAGVWLRGILASSYGLALDQVQWFSEHEEETPLEVPAGWHLERLPAGSDVDALVAAGELQGAIYPETLPAVTRGDPRVRRLFPDSRAEEQAFYRQTGIFPIMHTVVIRNTILEAHPWVAQSVMQAFEQVKERAYRRLDNPRTVTLAWVRDYVADEHAVLGPDPWVYGFEPNRANLEQFCAYGHEQGLTRRRLSVEELFVPSTLDELPRYAE
jgi:4,5-dihydroxyphthalate decarboxylase